jgi:cobalt-zinc-cadmium efflux system outer membrane protein
MHAIRFVAVTLVASVAACATAPPNAHDDLQRLLAERGVERVTFRTNSEADQQADLAVADLLQRKLTADDAVAVALLSNRHLQATYAELGVAQADLVEAGLLKNPTFTAQVRFPNRPPSAANMEFDVAMDFLDILLLPLRHKLAAQQYERAKLRVGDEVLRTAAEVRTAYYTLVAAQQTAAMRRAVLEAAEVSFDLTKRMHEAGNNSPLQVAQEQASLEQAKIEAARADGETAAAREQLTRLLGLHEAKFTTADSLDTPPDAADKLATVNIEHRLDIAAAKAEAQTLATALGITRDYRWLTAVEIGGNAERDTDKQWVAGPHIAIELPIFNRGDARIARAEAQLRQAEANLAALATDARSEIRAAHDRLALAHRLAQQYRTVLIPLRQQIVKLSQQNYNFMITGIFETIAARQLEYDAYEKYIDAVRDYWIARAHLERALGLKFTTPAAPAATPTKLPGAAEEHKHHD